MTRVIHFLFLIFLSFNVFAQTRLPGNFDLEERTFVPVDTNVLVGPFSENMAPFLIKGKNPRDYKTNRAGFIDSTGLIVIEPLYTDCGLFTKGLALARDTAGQIGMINKSNKIVFPFSRNVITRCSNGLYLLTAGDNRKVTDMSIVDEKNKVIVPFGKYTYSAMPSSIRFFKNSDKVENYSFWWTARQISHINFTKYLAVRLGEKWAIIDSTGKQLVPATKFDWVGYFETLNGSATYARVGLNGRQSLIGVDGKNTMPFKYDIVMLTPDNQVIVAAGDKQGLVTTDNKVSIPLKYNRIIWLYNDRFLVVKSVDGTQVVEAAVVNSAHKIIIPFGKHDIRSFGNGYSIRGDDGSYAVVDANGKQIINGIYDPPRERERVYDLRDGSGIYSKGTLIYNEVSKTIVYYKQAGSIGYLRDGKWGLLNNLGAETTMPIFDEIRELKVARFIAVRREKKWGIVDSEGRQILPYEFDDIDFPYVKKGSKYGVMNYQLQMLSPFKYDAIRIEQSDEGYGKPAIKYRQALINGKWGRLNSMYQEITPFKYDHIYDIKNGHQIVRENGKYGLINNNGVEIVPCLFDLIIPQQNRPLIVAMIKGNSSTKENRLYGLYDYEGKVIKQPVLSEEEYKHYLFITYPIK